MSKAWLLATALIVVSGGCAAKYRLVEISNSRPRRDAEGKIIDAHDGCLEYFDGRFYLYGTRYADANGFTKTNRYVCYSSEDLTAWHFHGEILAEPPEGMYYRPYVKYNENTGKYVLWYNWYPVFWEGRYGVATSVGPEGPFVIQDENVKVKEAQPGDLGLFVDDDGTGYIVYTSIEGGHAISVEKLGDSYLSSTLDNSGIIARGCEAPAMFKRDGVYYLLFDHTCCFCPQGTGARVYTADSPLGAYTLHGNINRDEAGIIIIPAQQTHIAQIPTDKGTTYLWMGDLWGSRPDGTKGHDRQYWSSPLKFRQDGTIERLVREDTWQVRIPAKKPVARK